MVHQHLEEFLYPVNLFFSSKKGFFSVNPIYEQFDYK